jgi:hypothetical protein
MNLTKLVPTAITSRFGRQLLKAQNVSPTVLFAGGVVGVVSTAVLASRATLKLEDILEKNEQDSLKAKEALRVGPDVYSANDYQKDMAIIYTRTVVDIAKAYGPAILVGSASIAALTGSHVILNRRYAAVTAAYAALDKGFREYRERVVDEFGEETDRKFRYSTETVAKKNEDGKEVTVKHMDPNSFSIYARFFDELCSAWQREPEYNNLFLRCQQNYANDLLHSRGHVFLNEVYDMLSMDRSKAGAVVGWVLSKDSDNFIDFGIFNGDRPRARDFVNGREGSILLDFNVDGLIYDKI